MIRSTGVETALLALAAVAAAPAMTHARQRPPTVQGTVVQARSQQIVLTVNGLSCPFCAYGLEKRLEKLDGVDSLHIAFKQGRVILYVRDAAKISDDRLHQVVKNAGFEVTKIERPSKGTPEADPGAALR